MSLYERKLYFKGKSMRSEQIYEFNHKISEININLSYFNFYTDQFLSDNQLAIQKLPEEFTSEFFEYNKFKDQFNIKLKGIPEQVSKYRGFIFDNLFINAYFYFEMYLKDMYKFIAENNLFDNLSDIGDTGILDNINHKLNEIVGNNIYMVTEKTLSKLKNRRYNIPQNTIDKLAPMLYTESSSEQVFFDELILRLSSTEIDKYKDSILKQSRYFFNYYEIRTMDYIRERRNAIVHSKVKLSEQVETIIDSADSIKLQDYWANYDYYRKDTNSKSKFKLKELDFSKKDLEFTSEGQLIEIFNLLRIIAKNIDSKILESIKPDRIEKYLIFSFKVKYQTETNKNKFSRFYTKFTTFSKILLDKKFTEDKVKEIFNGEVAQW